MVDARIQRFTAVAGIASVLLYALGDVLIIDLPPINESAQTFASYTASHGTQLLIFVYVWGVTVAAVLCFLTGFWSVLRGAERTSALLSTLGLGSGYLIWAIVLAGLGPVLVLGYLSHSLDPTTTKMLITLALLGATLSAFPTVVSVGAFSLLILRTGGAPRWIGWFGVVVVLAHLAAAGAFAQDGFFSPSVVSVFVAPPLYFSWVLLISTALLFRGGKRPLGTAQVASQATRV